MDRKTVRKHLEVGIAAPAYSPRPAQPRLIAPFEDYLRARITAWPDLSGKRLLRALRERGYLPFSASGGALLFHLLSKLYERTNVIITTNLGFRRGLRA